MESESNTVLQRLGEIIAEAPQASEERKEIIYRINKALIEEALAMEDYTEQIVALGALSLLKPALAQKWIVETAKNDLETFTLAYLPSIYGKYSRYMTSSTRGQILLESFAILEKHAKKDDLITILDVLSKNILDLEKKDAKKILKALEKIVRDCQYFLPDRVLALFFIYAINTVLNPQMREENFAYGQKIISYVSSKEKDFKTLWNFFRIHATTAEEFTNKYWIYSTRNALMEYYKDPKSYIDKIKNSIDSRSQRFLTGNNKSILI